MALTSQQIAQRIKSPANYFVNPKAVLEDSRLNTTQKIEILNSWKQEEEMLMVASEENMEGDSGGNLQAVCDALNQLERQS